MQSSFINRIIFSHSEPLEFFKSFIRTIPYTTPSEALSTHVFALSVPLNISLYFHSLNPVSSFSQWSTMRSHLADMVSFLFSTEK